MFSMSLDGCANGHYRVAWDGKQKLRGWMSYQRPVQSRARTKSIRYVASRKDAARFGKELYELATQCGMYQVDIDKQMV